MSLQLALAFAQLVLVGAILGTPAERATDSFNISLCRALVLIRSLRNGIGITLSRWRIASEVSAEKRSWSNRGLGKIGIRLDDFAASEPSFGQ